MPAKKISTEKAKPNKLFYFVANAVIWRKSDGKCLVLKRDEREKVHPGKWAVPGGKIEWEDLDINNPTRINGDVLDFEGAIEDLLKREALEEAGVEIEDQVFYINSVAFIRPDGIPVVLAKFAAKYKSGKVKPEEGAFVEYTWVDEKEVKKLDCIKGVPEEIAKTINLFCN